MANSLSSVLPMFLLFTILLALAQVTAAGRKVPTKANVVDKKQPESLLIGSDGSVLIPGIGRVQVPALGGTSFYPPYSGSGEGVGNTGEGGDSGTGSTGGGSPSYIPGGDDTFLPNPGVEIPSGSGGVPVPQTARP